MPAFEESCARDKVAATSSDNLGLRLEAAVSAANCDTVLGTIVDGAFTYGYGTHNYKVHVPSDYRDQTSPLLVMLHGCTQNPADIAAGTRLNLQSDALSCFVIYPAQSEYANPSRCWNWFSVMDQRRDQGEPAIIAGITRTVMQSYRIDATRVFVAGFSAGGAMAVIMAATYPDLFAAVGSHSGMPYRAAHNLVSALDAMRNGEAAIKRLGVAAIPLISFHGGMDKTVNPRNSQQLVSQWLQSIPARTRPHSSSEEEGEMNGRTYVRSLYRSMRGELLIEGWRVNDLGHAWSGGDAGNFADPMGPDASREMLRFFLDANPQSRMGTFRRWARSMKQRAGRK